MEGELKEKYLEYQSLVQQVQQLQQNLSAIENHILELTTLNENLQEVSKTKNLDDVFIPFGGGIFLNGKINNTNSVIMNVGAGVCVEKTTADASGIILKQLEDSKKIMEQLQEEFASYYTRIQELQAEFEKAKKDKK